MLSHVHALPRDCVCPTGPHPSYPETVCPPRARTLLTQRLCVPYGPAPLSPRDCVSPTGPHPSHPETVCAPWARTPPILC